MSIARFRTDFSEPETWRYPGLGSVVIDRSYCPDGTTLYRGRIDWDGAPPDLHELVLIDADHDVVQDACEARIVQGPGRPKP